MDHPGAHFLIAGDSRDIPAIGGMLARLPVGAYGQVFVEVASDVQVREWSVPTGISVFWLRRDLLPGGASRGELVARAIAAWVAEWMPERRDARAHPSVLWIGCSTSGRVDRLYRELDAPRWREPAPPTGLNAPASPRDLASERASTTTDRVRPGESSAGER